MPSPIDDVIRRRVVQQWINGFPRDKIASDLQIGAGTVSGIVSDFKKNLQGSDIDSVRESLECESGLSYMYQLYFVKESIVEELEQKYPKS